MRSIAVYVIQLAYGGDLLPRSHAIGKLARELETGNSARSIYRGSDHWRAARA
jgi:hypothetical protein